jgi:hypothetical protein
VTGRPGRLGHVGADIVPDHRSASGDHTPVAAVRAA